MPGVHLQGPGMEAHSVGLWGVAGPGSPTGRRQVSLPGSRAWAEGALLCPVLPPELGSRFLESAALSCSHLSMPVLRGVLWILG